MLNRECFHRQALAERALRFAREHFVDQAGARVLAELAAELCARPGE